MPEKLKVLGWWCERYEGMHPGSHCMGGPFSLHVALVSVKDVREMVEEIFDTTDIGPQYDIGWNEACAALLARLPEEE